MPEVADDVKFFVICCDGNIAESMACVWRIVAPKPNKTPTIFSTPTHLSPSLPTYTQQTNAYSCKIIKSMSDGNGNENKVVVVTGGTRGIGKAIAAQAIEAGHPVIITYRSDAVVGEEALGELSVDGARVALLEFDVTAFATFEAFAASVATQVTEWGGQLWGIVNNGGLATAHTLDATTEEQFDLMSNIHFKGPFFLVQALLSTLADNGRIVNITSGLSRFTIPGYGPYGAAKAALDQLTRYQAKELGPRGITANAVAPGVIATRLSADFRSTDQGLATAKAMSALNRVGEPDDVAAAVVFLLSPSARHITGERLEVSGGSIL